MTPFNSFQIIIDNLLSNFQFMKTQLVVHPFRYVEESFLNIFEKQFKTPIGLQLSSFNLQSFKQGQFLWTQTQFSLNLKMKLLLILLVKCLSITLAANLITFVENLYDPVGFLVLIFLVIWFIFPTVAN